ncbi:MAG TPA: caspase family protein [Terracidiphilus sp.]|nr:caspase family protein [Terracidiphilus sp.]
MKAHPVALAALAAVLVSAPLPSQTGGQAGAKRALLVGIDLYQPTGTQAQHPAGCHGGRCDLPVFNNLDGPLNDVAAMRDLLSSPKFGFDPKDIVIVTNPALPPAQLPFANLPPAATTHDGLLAAMQKYLVDVPQKGDTVVFYYAGHGSLRVNSKGTKLAMLVDGKPSHADSTLVPSDAWTGNYDIRDREMTRIFNASLDKGVRLTVLLDSCHSGSFTRGVEIGKQYTERSLGYDPRDIDEGPDLLPSGDEAPAPTERKTNPALVFSAAQQDQTAKERDFGDTPSTTVAHGAFTVALIKALETLPADAPASDVYRQVSATLEGEQVGDQTPALDASEDRMREPLFGGMKADAGKTRAAVIGVDEDEGTVLLDAGQLSGIDAGSEFTSLGADSEGRHTKLKVDSLDGLAHATAKVVTPLKATVTVGQVFELSKWVPSEIDTLHVWTWPANLGVQAIEGTVEQVKTADVSVVDDPVEKPWTDMLAWNGSAWELRHAGQTVDTPMGASLTADAVQTSAGGAARICADNSLTADEKQALSAVKNPAISYQTDVKGCDTFLLKQNGAWLVRHVERASTRTLGPTVDAAALKQALGAEAKLWVNLPPPQELAARLALHVDGSLVKGVDDVAGADYILAGSLSDDGPQWAWFHKVEYMAGPRAAQTHDHSPGCSTNSKYPVASDWVVLADPASAADASSVLNGYAERLAKVNGWLNIADNLSGASDAEYYSLVFKRITDQSVLPEGVAAKQNERFKMYLSSDDQIIEKRWVYVLDIDCHGKGSLLYPLDTADNRFPNDADTPMQFVLPGAPTLRIGAPYGVDTVLLISTQEPLPDPYALNFEGVSTRGGSAGASNPLQQLLSGASAGTRGPLPEMPTNWSIDAMTLKSIPEGAQ